MASIETEAATVLLDAAGVVLNERGLSEILTPSLRGEIEEFGTDTQVTESILDSLARKTVGSSWPRYRDKIDTNGFVDRIKSALHQKGWS